LQEAFTRCNEERERLALVALADALVLSYTELMNSHLAKTIAKSISFF